MWVRVPSGVQNEIAYVVVSDPKKIVAMKPI
jgi:hypothetical protein